MSIIIKKMMIIKIIMMIIMIGVIVRPKLFDLQNLSLLQSLASFRPYISR